MFWKSLEIPKKRDVASLVGNLSPVKRRRAILVRSMRHLLGEIGDELNNRAEALYFSTKYFLMAMSVAYPLGKQMSCQP